MPLQDIHPKTPVRALRRDYSEAELELVFPIDLVAALVGMQFSFVRQVVETRSNKVSLAGVLELLDQDAFTETFIPRSLIPNYLLQTLDHREPEEHITLQSDQRYLLVQGDAKHLLSRLSDNSINCAVTSTPYWGTRIYDNYVETVWADGEICSFGHEQTPEGFIRHSVELLYQLKRVMAQDGSIWWNLMDTYNTRTQIRGNAAETLRAMRGEDSRGWKDFECRRYSAGHSFLFDGEQCMIPSRVAERASHLGYWVKSIIYWKKEGSMPETVDSRVTREAEVIIHLTLQRTPYFDKQAYRELPKSLGGRNPKFEADKVTDVWCLPTANGTDGHGAQFPLSLPGRCIGFSTRENDVILDPFIGSGTSALAALKLNRRVIGFDVSAEYLEITLRRLEKENLTEKTDSDTSLQPRFF